MNELGLGEGYTLFAPSEHIIMQTISVDIPLRWPVSVDITMKVDNIY